MRIPVETNFQSMSGYGKSNVISNTPMSSTEKIKPKSFERMNDLLRTLFYIIVSGQPVEASRVPDRSIRKLLDREWQDLLQDAADYQEKLDSEVSSTLSMLNFFIDGVRKVIVEIPDWRDNHLLWQADTWANIYASESSTHPENYSLLEHYWLRAFFSLLQKKTSQSDAEAKITNLIELLIQVSGGSIDLSEVIDVNDHIPPLHQNYNFFKGYLPQSSSFKSPTNLSDGGRQTPSTYPLDLVGYDPETKQQTVWLKEAILKVLLSNLAVELSQQTSKMLRLEEPVNLEPVPINSSLPIAKYWELAEQFLTDFPSKYLARLQRIFSARVTQETLSQNGYSYLDPDYLISSCFSTASSSHVGRWLFLRKKQPDFQEKADWLVQIRRLSEILLLIKSAADMEIEFGQPATPMDPSSFWRLQDRLQSIKMLIQSLSEFEALLPAELYKDLVSVVSVIDTMSPLLEVKPDILDNLSL